MKNYMHDRDFLYELQTQRQREVFVKITSLNFAEEPIEEIQGRVTQGSINVDGSSAVRRSCSLTFVANELKIHDYYWGLKTKFKLEIGLKNTINSDYPDIVWFKQGIYLITSFSTQEQSNSYTINISGKDKMALLNGEMGGVITALSFDFGKMKVIDEFGYIKESYDKLIPDIIIEAVHEFSQDPYHKIIVKDLDEHGLKLMEYRGNVPMYIYVYKDGSVNAAMSLPDKKYWPEEVTEDSIIFDSRINILDDMPAPTEFRDDQNQSYTIIKCMPGEAVAYEITDLVYTGDLIGAVGQSLTTACLDKIKNMLGDFEYFYDVDGNFVFQRKLTYVNRSYNNIITQEQDYLKVTINKLMYKPGQYYIQDINNRYIYVICEDVEFDENQSYYQKMPKEDYVEYSALSSPYSWSFTDTDGVISFQNNPNIGEIKNDFSVWGTRKSVSGAEIPVHLRYAIDKKPEYYKALDGKVYITEDYINSFQSDGEITVQTIRDVFKKTPLIEGMGDDWWVVTDWARYYAWLNGYKSLDELLADRSNDFYNTTLGHYLAKDAETGEYKLFSLDELNQIIPSPLIDTYKTAHSFLGVYLFDTKINDAGHEEVAYLAHNPSAYITDITKSCSHSYASLLTLMSQNKYYRSYFYRPQLPEHLMTEEMKKKLINSENENIVGAITCDWREIIYQMAKDHLAHNTEEDFLIKIAHNNPNHYASGYTGYEQYYTDIVSFWRQVYVEDNETFEDDIIKYGFKWNEQIFDDPSSLNFWFDFMDIDQGLSQFSVKNIGIRPKAENSKDVKSIYYREVPNIILYENGKANTRWLEDMKQEKGGGYSFLQMPSYIKQYFNISSQGKSAIKELESLLSKHALAQASVSISTMPIYSLQPNTLIDIQDDISGIHGEYVVNKITIPLTYNGTMSISAIKVQSDSFDMTHQNGGSTQESIAKAKLMFQTNNREDFITQIDNEFYVQKEEK